MERPLIDSTDLRWLAGLARALLGESHAADDLVQDTLVAALETGQPPVRRRAWLGSVARRLAARRFRTEMRRTRRESSSARPEALPDSADLVARAEISELVAASARALPEPFRRTILLRFLDGHTPAEIAERDGVPVDTVRARVRRGLELLRAELVRRGDRDWSQMCVLLLPLARSGASAGAASAASASGLSGLVYGWFVMKGWVFVTGIVVALCSSGLWWSWNAAPLGEPGRPLVADPEPSSTEPVAVVLPNVEKETERTVVVDAAVEEGEASVGEATRTGVFGRVLDPDGASVAGATVYLLAPGARRGDVLAKTSTEEMGSFFLSTEDLEDSEAPLDLGIVANGFLRRVVRDAAVNQPSEGYVVILERGELVTGRVLDEFGRGVPDLELIAHTGGAGIDHVSPSQMGLRAGRAELGGSDSTYFNCRARTDAAGNVTFRGLPEGKVYIWTLEPGWSIADPRDVRAGDTNVVWTARRELGVRLRVVDAKSGRPVGRVKARFWVDLAFADGEVADDLGKWVGRGDGGASFALTAEELPQIEGRTVTRAEFHGTLETDAGETKWRAEPMEDVGGVAGVAEVRVEVEGASPTEPEVEEPEPKPWPTGVVELDVRYDDGAPYDGVLSLAWSVRSEDRTARDSSQRIESLTPGRFRVELPTGEVSMSIGEWGASGSLSRWTGSAACIVERPAVASVVLPRGATAEIVRPEGWTGVWRVHASWRAVGDEEWSGSWNYGTEDETLVLRSLRAAEWRFRLSRPESEEAPVERVVEMATGERRVVD